ncbi:putative membrane protein [Brevibacillus laterosporus GI-9]|nr:putative membrane protein [Brevibacillus laterosporus GI-9]
MKARNELMEGLLLIFNQICYQVLLLPLFVLHLFCSLLGHCE